MSLFAMLLSPRKAVPCLVLGLMLIAAPAVADEFPEIVNTQKEGEHPPSPHEAAAAIKLPEGFQATLFAGEPDVAQPIAMDFDDRGRLWVAECYTYTGRSFTDEQRDRIIVFEDADNDGRHDTRTVFWDQGRALTSVCWGSGGVFILNDGTLAHLSDRNGDDRPDGEPAVLLDGFDTGPVGHNIVNGLMWGPDGWLYGRHGIQATSYVGKPGDAQSKRTALNCSIWRYHPQSEAFEVVTNGTTNPWGLDYDEHGQFFFTNNVIGHLWHVVPGAHYQRMYGEDFNPHLYALIDQTADHYHWEHSKGWTNSRLAEGPTDELGGGHSHCGGMIYLGDNWPEQYRGGMFTCNVHGRRINHDRLLRRGTSYVGEHADDFMHAGQQWFRGLELRYGPDGGVYVSDWSDLGECHDNDGVHRTSGRIYKITYGDVSKKKRADGGDISRLTDAELVALHRHANQWYVRRARRVLTERSLAENQQSPAAELLRRMLTADGDAPLNQRLDALWTLACLGQTDAALLAELLGHQHEQMRIASIRLLLEQGSPDDEIVRQFASLAAEDDSPLVRLYLASAMQKLPLADRWAIARNLVAHEEDAQDHHLRLMTWYGIEPAVAAQPDEALAFIEHCRWPLLQQFAARRLTYDMQQHPQPVAGLYKLLRENDSDRFRREILTGMTLALSGRKQVAAPLSWGPLREQLLKSSDETVRRLTQELAVVHGDGRALDQLLRLAADGSKSPTERRAALEVLITARPEGLPGLLLGQLGDRATGRLAIRGLASYDEPKAAAAILNRYGSLPEESRREAIATLTSRAVYATALLDAVAGGRVPASDISAFHARQMQSLDDDRLTARLAELWGTLRTTPAERREEIDRLRDRLPASVLAQADLAHGRQLFSKNCGNCHALYGEGENIGPDLTGSGRHNLDYLLENIVDPSATVATQFRMSTLRLANGQVVTGVIVQQTDQILTVQTEKERLNLETAQVDEIKQSPLSLMPDNLLKPLSEEEIRDLFAYLQSKGQVELPPGEASTAAGQ